MNKIENYTSTAKQEPGKTEITNEAFALAEVISELTDAIKRLTMRFNG